MLGKQLCGGSWIGCFCRVLIRGTLCMIAAVLRPQSRADSAWHAVTSRLWGSRVTLQCVPYYLLTILP